MGKVIPLNNVTRLDLPVDQVLEGTIGKLEDIIVLGYDKNGEEYFASSLADGADVLWLLERCKIKLLEIVENTEEQGT